MWIKQIDTVTDEMFENARFDTTTEDRKGLLVRSTYLAAIGKGRELMFVLGVIPPTRMSQIAYLWMSVMKDARFTLPVAREFARKRVAFFSEVPYNLRAEAMDKQAARWLTFLGAKPLGQVDERMIFGWSE